MKLAKIVVVGLLGLTLAAPVLAQPGAGAGKGMRFNKDNTAGWSLMSAEERTAHRDKMLSAKTYDECKAMQDELHKIMEARAKDKGLTLPAPRQNVCDRMKARGMFK